MMKEDKWHWQNYPTLLVEFMDDEVPPEWEVGGDPINKRNILDWANIWHLRGGRKIPVFDLAKPREKAQIRIKFNSKTTSCFRFIVFCVLIGLGGGAQGARPLLQCVLQSTVII